MWGSILSFALPLFAKLLAKNSFDEGRVKEFIEWVKGERASLPPPSQAADWESRATAEILERIRRESEARGESLE